MSHSKRPSEGFPVTRGDILQLAEGEYLYGLGPLILRITQVLHVQQVGGRLWLYVRGKSIRREGAPDLDCYILIRLDVLMRSSDAAERSGE